MARVVVHIGTGKTGTSYLQSTLRQNAPGLARVGWTYPQYLPRQSHVDIAIALLDTPTDVHVPVIPELRTLAAREAHLAWLGEQFDRDVSPNSNWIITSENFQGALLTPDLVRKFADWLRRWFDDVVFVCYFRRQDFMVPTLYTETAKSWVPGSELGELDWAFVDEKMPWLRYDRSAALWQNAIGDGCRYVARPYLERWKSDGVELLSDFVTATQMPPTADWKESDGDQQNRAISAQGVEFLRFVAPEVSKRVLADPSGLSRESVGDDTLGHALAPFITQRNGAGYFEAGWFNNAVAEQTPGAPLRMTQELADQVAATFRNANELLVDDASEDRSWSDWLDQPGVQVRGSQDSELTDERKREVLEALASRGTTDRSAASRVRRKLGKLRRKLAKSS